MPRKSILVFVAIALLFAGIVFSQARYDAVPQPVLQGNASLPPDFIRYFDFGLHSAMASVLWIGTRPELPSFPFSYPHFKDGLDLINNLDPKFAYPYVFTVLVLPNTTDPHRFTETAKIGERGIREADPDWRLPLYLAANYQLYLNDYANAAKYFDLASRTPGVPDIIRRFAVNYGIAPNNLERTRQVWLAIYESTEDPFIKERAKNYVIHTEIIQYLDQAIAVYRARYGTYPQTIDALAAKGIIKEIPPDPFGYQFDLYENGSVVGIKKPAT